MIINLNAIIRNARTSLIMGITYLFASNATSTIVASATMFYPSRINLLKKVDKIVWNKKGTKLKCKVRLLKLA